MLVTTPSAGEHSPPAPHLQYVRAIGPNIRAAREKLRLTQTQLAERSGLSFGWISAVETGRRVPCVENLVRLCIAVGMGLDAAIGMRGAP